MRAIARLLGQGDVESADWKINSLAKLGALNEQAVAIIRSYRDAIHEGVLTEVEKAAFDTLLQSDALFQRAKDAGATLTDVLPADADPAIRNLIEVWQKQAIIQTNLAMATLLENTGQVYVETLNRTTMQVLSGAMSGREALVTAVREWSESGVPSIVDRAGRQWTTEAYANMVIRSNVRNVTTAVQMERGRQYGNDLIEVSAHAGARPLCAPYQGRVFSVSGQTEGYPKLSETSYGQPAGLFGINCGHNQYPFWEGVSRQRYAPDDTPEQVAENERAYLESQKQRYLERHIRAAKRAVSVWEAKGDAKNADLARQTVRDRQKTMRDFIADTGRTRRNAREQVLDAPTKQDSKRSGFIAEPEPSEIPAQGVAFRNAVMAQKGSTFRNEETQNQIQLRRIGANHLVAFDGTPGKRYLAANLAETIGKMTFEDSVPDKHNRPELTEVQRYKIELGKETYQVIVFNNARIGLLLYEIIQWTKK